MSTPAHKWHVGGTIVNCISAKQGNVSRDGEFERHTHDRAFYAVVALLFFCSAAATIVGCASMSAMSGMPMPGGWTMSMAWMRMPGQSWINAAALFVGMWMIMMVAMMLPSLTPMLSRYRSALGKMHATRLGKLTASAGAGYFFVWALAGVAIFPLGIALATFEMQTPALARTTPIAIAIVILVAGIFQFTAQKAHYLNCCREPPENIGITPVSVGAAWQHGLRLGARCLYCCANLTMILLVIGVMDLGAMFIVTVAISAERLASNSRRAAHAVGVVTIVAGIFMLTRAVMFC